MIDARTAPERSAGGAGFSLLVALAEDGHTHGLAEAMGKGHSTADHLVGVLGVDAQTESDIDRFIKFSEGSAKGLGNRVLHGKTLGQINAFQRIAIFFSMRRHDGIPFFALVVSNLLPASGAGSTAESNEIGAAR